MFVDTNVLVYARIAESSDHHVAAAQLRRAAQNAEPRRISRQIIREYLAVLTRPQPWSSVPSRQEALDDIDDLFRGYEILEDSPQVTQTLLALCRQIPISGRQIHDANIVATMLAYGEHRLLTFNTSDFRRYQDRIELVDA